MFSSCKTPHDQGNVGVGYAIAYFTKLGFRVCIPLNDTQEYDLIVDDGKSLQTVQVKTTDSKTREDKFRVELRTRGGWYGNKVKHFDNSRVDLLFVLTAENKVYVIPTRNLKNKSCINLGVTYDKYAV